MTSITAERLDTDELLHLALRASDDNRHEEAISLLKRALVLSPDDGKLHYMLGAEHAQIGMYDRAADEMARAIELDPALHTAAFQLGLLHLGAARVTEAEAAWAPLDALSSDHFLYLFKTGLLHLVRDEFEDSARLLRQGLEANQFNAALNDDMRKVLEQVEQRMAPATTASAALATPIPAASDLPRGTPRHALLSAYRELREDDKE